MAETKPYDRRSAVEYGTKWAYGRNPAYLDFAELGGDCTNFVSQCLFAGSGVMNYTPVTGWFYVNPSNRTASWTGVEFLGRFLLRGASSTGPAAEEVPISQLEPGDVVQLGNENGHFYHSLLVVYTDHPAPNGIYLCTHDFDAEARRLSSYTYEKARFLHITGVYL